MIYDNRTESLRKRHTHTKAVQLALVTQKGPELTSTCGHSDFIAIYETISSEKKLSKLVEPLLCIG